MQSIIILKIEEKAKATSREELYQWRSFSKVFQVVTGSNQSEVMSFENSEKQKQNNFLLAITELIFFR